MAFTAEVESVSKTWAGSSIRNHVDEPMDAYGLIACFSERNSRDMSDAKKLLAKQP